MVKHTTMVRVGPKFIEFQQNWKKNIGPLIGSSDRHVIKSPWLTDRIAEILENDLNFTQKSMEQLKKRRGGFFR